MVKDFKKPIQEPHQATVKNIDGQTIQRGARYTDKYTHRSYWVEKKDDILLGLLAAKLIYAGEREKTDKSELIREAMRDLLKKYQRLLE